MRGENRKRVLVTGGARFLGSHLCERLLDMGCDVLCVDNLYCVFEKMAASELQGLKLVINKLDSAQIDW